MKKVLYLILSFSTVFIFSQIGSAQIFPHSVVTNYAGDTTAGFSGDGGQATAAHLYYPHGIATDNAGNLFIGDVGNHRIRMVSPEGLITTIAGNGTEGCSGDGGQAVAAQLNARYMATDATGSLYFCDAAYNRVRKIQMSGVNTGIVTTIAGNGIAGFSGDGGFANAAQLNKPMGLAVDGNGNIYVADNGNSRVRLIDAQGGITTIAGGGTTPIDSNAPATAAKLLDIRNIATGPAGSIYLCDGDFLRKIDASGIITTIAGAVSIPTSGTGVTPINIELKRPEGIVVDDAGNVFFAEALNNSIKKLNNTGSYTYVRSRGLNTPIGLAKGTANQLYVSEYGNNIVAKITNSTLGTEQISQQTEMPTIFPNPAHTQFIVNLPSSCKEEVNISLQNVSGQIVQWAYGKGNVQIRLNSLMGPGLYFVTVSGAGYNATTRLIID